jgi:Flp pilus assembly pilin Flp
MTTTWMVRRLLRKALASETGVTLIETAVACGLMVVVLAGVAAMTTLATKLTENEGHLTTRTAEYAVDKMEQLQELTYGDAQSNTTVFPSVTSGGTGLADGGSADPSTPVVGYADYLDTDGNPLCTVATPCSATAPSSWYYRRVWQVCSSLTGGATGCPAGLPVNMKQIKVTATVRSSVGNVLKAKSSVVSFKTDCPAGC